MNHRVTYKKELRPEIDALWAFAFLPSKLPSEDKPNFLRLEAQLLKKNPLKHATTCKSLVAFYGADLNNQTL